MGQLLASSALGLDAFEGDPIELRPNFTEDDLQIAIRAVYKQVLGNAHVLEGQGLTAAESSLRNGDITVRGFVRAVAQSDLYQSRFFNSSSAYRFIELNCKHLLGRAPLDQAEISEHVQTYNSNGYETEINSYIDSEEYINSFGENIVPYPRSIRSQTGVKNVGFNRMFSLLRGSATSDAGQSARLIGAIANNAATAIKPLAKGNSSSGSTGKRFRIVATRGGNVRRSNNTYEVSYDRLSATVQNIQKSGGKISSITEIA